MRVVIMIFVGLMTSPIWIPMVVVCWAWAFALLINDSLGEWMKK
ncbi:hypothetical protein LCGC14_1281410 [marine sediment metagenome]|uniref:Uncharacterized protein n=1 Tax=marine sediment metagenome TaxID=412755 RepID=A0A0F9NBN6_9ZZZZ